MTRGLVIGDTIIDEDVHALGSGLSLESPTIKANFREKTYSLDGAANLVRHLCQFHDNIDFFTSVSGVGLELLNKLNVTVHAYSNPHLNTKTRFWIERGDSVYKVLQINNTKFLNKRV